MSPLARRCPALIGAVCLLVAACHREPPAGAPPGPEVATAKANPDAAERNEIPTANLGPVLEAHLRGLGHIERYEYNEAAEAFGEVRRLAPGWVPGAINRAIALLNQSGNADAKADGARGAAPPKTNFDEALELLGEALRRDPSNLHAHYCRGIILEHLGKLAEAHAEFRAVTEADPADGHAWYKLGSTLTDPADPNRPPGREMASKQIELFTKALECNPYLVPALFKLQTAYRLAGQPEEAKEMAGLWAELNPKRTVTGSGESVESFYGDMGRYARVIDPGVSRGGAARTLAPPRFDPPAPLHVALPEGDRWVKEADFEGPLAVVGRARARFGAAVATFDADGDGRLDLFLAAAIKTPGGIRDALLLNRGDGAFEDATEAAHVPTDRVSLGVAAGDFDADGRIDLFLTGVGDNRLLRNAGGKAFEDVTEALGKDVPPAVSPTARWLDLDQDGDLDLYVINYTSAENAPDAFTDSTPPGMANAAYRNDGKPAPIAGRPQDNWAPRAVAPEDLEATEGLSLALTPWTGQEALLGGDRPHTGLAALDLDGDRDQDLVLTADPEAITVVLNDRIGRFHATEMDALEPKAPASGLLAADLDADGLSGLVTTGQGGVGAQLNRTERGTEGPRWSFKEFPTDARGWRSAVAADLDLDGATDLVGLPGPEAAALGWARNEGGRLATADLALGPDEPAPVQGFALADLAGDPLPDFLIVRDGEGPRLARNLGNGKRWLALTLNGRWTTGHNHMRTNPHGLGARVSLEGRDLHVVRDHSTPEAGPAQSVAPFVLGLGSSPRAELVRIHWPDGVMQCELDRAAGRRLDLIETNRKTGSCPVLFAWDDERFVCLGDFLGGGGLGYLVAPGVYAQPDRDESVAIAPEQLRAVEGVYRLVVTEPMDEVAYLDRLTLDVIDRPPGVETAPDERFAPSGPRPTGALLAWRESINPVRASDLNGADVTDLLRQVDRRTVDDFRKLGGWIGYAEEHGIVLDFGDRLARFGPGDRLVLGLAGWVEYPYSQTNYAAATAGVSLNPPVLERLREDGTWEVIAADAGYPAGLPRLTTLELAGKLGGPRCVLRLRTNMECYWDHAFVAVLEPGAGVRVRSLGVSRAVLGDRGFTREASPDGRLPLLYDYEHVEAAPLARPEGLLTRFGDVAGLLRADDDRLCLVGPGDEVRLEFDGRDQPELPEGWTRAYVLRAVGYCKDADPFTADSDTVGPLPWRGMPAYPFGPEGERPSDPGYREYLRTYQTRPAGAR